MSQIFDFIVIGGGAAGASAACELSRHGSVALLEQEATPGYHSTGRSAAAITEAYGPLGWQILTTASRPFLEAPPAGLAEAPLLRRIGALYLATAEEAPSLQGAAAELARRGVVHELMPAAASAALCPVVRLGGFTLALHDPGCADIDANSLLHGYLRLARRNGATIALSAAAQRIERTQGLWVVTSEAQQFRGRRLINAAGAWADAVAERAGLGRLGLVPHRRTAIIVPVPPEHDAARWPMTFDVAETWYFKPESGGIMVSPVDKTPMPPGDCAPDELEIAIAVDRLERATTLKVERVASRWAGLRTFTADHQPVVGPDPREPSFIWLAGQGGNGVMASPAAAQLAAAYAVGDDMPKALRRLGLTPELVTPARLLRTAQ